MVSGPTNAGNGALDYNGTFDISGGTLIAAGSAGMAQAPSDCLKQYSMHMTYPETQKAGTLLHVEDSKGNTIITFAPEKGGTYTLYTGGSSTGSNANGFYTDGDYSGGTKVVNFKIEDSVTWLNESGTTTPASNGPGGGPDGGRGNRADMFSNLDENTKARAEDIMEKERAGTITREEAQAHLKELGIDFSAGKGPQQ
ncbi:hypothetical protein V7659_23405 [Neobacillus drentensis]